MPEQCNQIIFSLSLTRKHSNKCDTCYSLFILPGLRMIKICMCVHQCQKPASGCLVPYFTCMNIVSYITNQCLFCYGFYKYSTNIGHKHSLQPSFSNIVSLSDNVKNSLYIFCGSLNVFLVSLISVHVDMTRKGN